MADAVTEISKVSKENFVVANRIYILGPFDRSISSEVIPAFIELIDQLQFTKDAVIEIYINSYGGFCAELMGLISVIDIAKSHGIKIVTYNIGVAYSCGSMLSILGDYRIMHKYATNLPHLGQASIDPQTFEQLERGAKYINDHFSMIRAIYLKYTKMPKSKIDKVLNDDDYYMNAEECKKFGFCDETI